MRKKATSVRRDLGKIDTAEADLETVRIRCMVLVSQILSAKSIPPEVEAECWITLEMLLKNMEKNGDDISINRRNISDFVNKIKTALKKMQ